MLSKEVKSFLEENPNGVVFIVGPTAGGKTKLSLELVDDGIDAEIISADSRQIFKYMNIGTDKVSQDIIDKIPHHLIDVCKPDEFFTAGDWKKKALEKVQDIQQRGKVPFVVGGTGLYTDTLYKNYSLPKAEPDFEFREKLYKEEEKNPGILHKKLQKIDSESAMILHPNSTRYIIRALEIYEKTGKPKSEVCYEQEVPFPIFMIIKYIEKDFANPKINKRIKKMFEKGLVKEVKNLLDMGYSETNQGMQSIGYKEIIPYIKGKESKEKVIENFKKNTHRYAKKQRTFFRRYIQDMKINPKKNVVYKIL